MDYENENENDMNDDINNYDEENNEFNEYNEYEQENNNEENVEEFNENDINMIYEENEELKKKCQVLNNVLIKKNNELEQLKKDYMKIKQELNNYKKINQNLNNQINNVNQKYSEVLKEIRIKNKMISDLEFGNKNLKDINLNEHKNENDENIILSINDQIKNFQKEFFEEENIENEPNNNNEIQNTDKNSLTQLVSNTLNTFMEKLNNYKNENMKEIVKLRNILDSNNKIDISEQYYQKIIDTIKNLCFTIPNNTLNFSKFPTFSKNDNNETKSKNILVSINILSDYIISNNKNNNKNIN